MKRIQERDCFEKILDQTQDLVSLRIKTTRGLNAFLQLTTTKRRIFIFVYHNTQSTYKLEPSCN